MNYKVTLYLFASSLYSAFCFNLAFIWPALLSFPQKSAKKIFIQAFHLGALTLVEQFLSTFELHERWKTEISSPDTYLIK